MIDRYTRGNNTHSVKQIMAIQAFIIKSVKIIP